MGVSIEWIRPDVGIARSGPQHQVFQDPYCASVVIDGQGEIAIYKGLTEPVSREDWRALEDLLRRRGFQYYVRDVVREGALDRQIMRKL